MALCYALTLFCEGLLQFLRRLNQSIRISTTSILTDSLVMNATVNLSMAALIASESSAIYLRGGLFTIAWTLKMLYLLFNASTLLRLFISATLSRVYHDWLIVRFVFTLLWIGVCMGDALWWKDQDYYSVAQVASGRSDFNDSEYSESTWTRSENGDSTCNSVL